MLTDNVKLHKCLILKKNSLPNIYNIFYNRYMYVESQKDMECRSLAQNINN